MSLFSIPSGYLLVVADVAAATAWYKQKFDLKSFGIADGSGEERGSTFLAYDENGGGIDLVATGAPGEERPIIYAADVKKAYNLLSNRGVTVGDIQTDTQGTHFFEIRDLDGNVLEICEEP